jgi:hypothetical protein
VCIPGATLVEICFLCRERKRLGFGRVPFAIAGLATEIAITCYFFNAILLFLTSTQIVVVSQFSIDIDIVATMGLMLTIFFFFYLWWYLKDANANFQWYVVLPAMIFSLIFVPVMMVVAPTRAIFGYSALLSSVIVLGISLAGTYVTLSSERNSLTTKDQVVT